MEEVQSWRGRLNNGMNIIDVVLTVATVVVVLLGWRGFGVGGRHARQDIVQIVAAW